ncbi:MAG TPA: hypothetical protein VIP46_03090 [Pyrinomonadaceae bacterium]
MRHDRDTLEAQLQEYEEQLRSLNSYVRELKAKTAEHGTAGEHFESDLSEAEHNIFVLRRRDSAGEGRA